ncbi:unnamed protein product, partial [Amoebophrya sp. A120]
PRSSDEEYFYASANHLPAGTSRGPRGAGAPSSASHYVSSTSNRTITGGGTGQAHAQSHHQQGSSYHNLDFEQDERENFFRVDRNFVPAQLDGYANIWSDGLDARVFPSSTVLFADYNSRPYTGVEHRASEVEVERFQGRDEMSEEHQHELLRPDNVEGENYIAGRPPTTAAYTNALDHELYYDQNFEKSARVAEADRRAALLRRQEQPRGQDNYKYPGTRELQGQDNYKQQQGTLEGRPGSKPGSSSTASGPRDDTQRGGPQYYDDLDENKLRDVVENLHAAITSRTVSRGSAGALGVQGRVFDHAGGSSYNRGTGSYSTTRTSHQVQHDQRPPGSYSSSSSAARSLDPTSELRRLLEEASYGLLQNYRTESDRRREEQRANLANFGRAAGREGILRDGAFEYIMDTDLVGEQRSVHEPQISRTIARFAEAAHDSFGNWQHSDHRENFYAENQQQTLQHREFPHSTRLPRPEYLPPPPPGDHYAAPGTSSTSSTSVEKIITSDGDHGCTPASAVTGFPQYDGPKFFDDPPTNGKITTPPGAAGDESRVVPASSDEERIAGGAHLRGTAKAPGAPFQPQARAGVAGVADVAATHRQDDSAARELMYNHAAGEGGAPPARVVRATPANHSTSLGSKGGVYNYNGTTSASSASRPSPAPRTRVGGSSLGTWRSSGRSEMSTESENEGEGPEELHQQLGEDFWLAGIRGTYESNAADYWADLGPVWQPDAVGFPETTNSRRGGRGGTNQQGGSRPGSYNSTMTSGGGAGGLSRETAGGASATTSRMPPMHEHEEDHYLRDEFQEGHDGREAEVYGRTTTSRGSKTTTSATNNRAGIDYSGTTSPAPQQEGARVDDETDMIGVELHQGTKMKLGSTSSLDDSSAHNNSVRSDYTYYANFGDEMREVRALRIQSSAARRDLRDEQMTKILERCKVLHGHFYKLPIEFTYKPRPDWTSAASKAGAAAPGASTSSMTAQNESQRLFKRR